MRMEGVSGVGEGIRGVGLEIGGVGEMVMVKLGTWGIKAIV